MPALRGSMALPALDHYGGRSTATTPLGHLLSFGTHHGVGNTGPVPSGTSRYYSVDLGLVHFIALDLNMYAYTAEPYQLRSITSLYLPTLRSVILCREFFGGAGTRLIRLRLSRSSIGWRRTYR